MNTFLLKIATPDGMLFEGNVQRVVCRTITGDLAVMARHANMCTALGMGGAHVVLEDGNVKNATCIGGMLSVLNGECSLFATTWEWDEDIDFERAELAKKEAEEMLKNKSLSEQEYVVARAKLKRALVRLSARR